MNNIILYTISQELGASLMQESLDKLYTEEFKTKYTDFSQGFSPAPFKPYFQKAKTLEDKVILSRYYYYEILEHYPHMIEHTYTVLLDDLTEIICPTGMEKTLSQEVVFWLNMKLAGYVSTLEKFKNKISKVHYKEHQNLLSNIRKSIRKGKYDLYLLPREDLDIDFKVKEYKDDEGRDDVSMDIHLTKKEYAKGVMIHPDSQVNDVTKIHTILSVEQLGYLFKLLYESNIVFNETVSKAQVRQMLKTNFATARSTNISSKKLEAVMAENYIPESSKTKESLELIVSLLNESIKRLPSKPK